MFVYNIAKTANVKAFNEACKTIKKSIRNVTKEELLNDVDGTQIQIYTTPNGKIRVLNDYEVDAVYVESEVNLKDVF